jgi:hypothetical protein
MIVNDYSETILLYEKYQRLNEINDKVGERLGDQIFTLPIED